MATDKLNAILICLVSMVATGRCAAADAAVAELCDNHRAAVNSIHTFYCKYRSNNLTGSGAASGYQFPPGEYWRGAGGTRYKWQSGGQTGDVWTSDGRVTSLVKRAEGGKVTWTGTIEAASSTPDQICDPWYRAMFTFPQDDGRNVPFWVLVKEGTGRFQSLTKEPDGVLVYTEKHPDGGVRKYHFDPSVNYLIRKFESDWTDSKGRTRRVMSEVKRFKEVDKGVHFPAESVFSFFRQGEPEGTEHYTFTDIKANAPVPPDVFSSKFPASTRVHNLIDNTEYLTGGDGEPTGEIRPLSAAPSPPAANGGVDNSRTETKEETPPWSWWLLPGSLAVLTAALILWMVQRVRRGKTK